MEELRGASKGTVGSSRSLERDGRGSPEPPVQQHASGLWDRQGRLTTKYNPYQSSESDTTHTLDIKEHVCLQRKMFSQPPGYIAPPPYNNPQKSSALVYQRATSWEQGDKSLAFWTQPALKTQDVSVNLENKKKRDKEEVTKPEAGETFTEPRELKQRKQKADSSTDAKQTNTQTEQTLPQQAAHGPKICQELPSKVIEGRKFRLNRKTGRMTIFCLVSRMADSTETTSLPLSFSLKNKQSTEKESVPESSSVIPEVDQAPKMSDEVDFRAPTPDAAQMEMLTSAEKDTASFETSEADAESTSENHEGRTAQPVGVKYPLWREPSFTNRTEAEGSTLRADKSDLQQQDAAKVSDEEADEEQNPNDTDDSKGLLVIDTSCVVVKVQMIPSLKKEHVHYLDAAGNPQTIQSDAQATAEDVATDHQSSHLCKDDPISVLMKEEEHKDESQMSFSCMKPAASPERETLDENAENIIQSPLPVCITTQRQEDGSNVEDPQKRAAPSLSEQPSEETTAEHFSEEPRAEQPQEKRMAEQSEEDVMDGQPGEETMAEEPANDPTPEKPSEKIQPQTAEDEHFPEDPADGVELEEDIEEGRSLKSQDVIPHRVTEEGPEDLVGCHECVADVSEEIESHLETDNRSLAEPEMSEDLQLETTNEQRANEQTQTETESSQLSDLHQFSSSSVTGSVWESSVSELTQNPHPVTPPPAPTGNFSTSSTLQEDHRPSPSPSLDVTGTAGFSSGDEDGVEKMSNLPEKEVNRECLGADTSEEEAFQHQAEPQTSLGAAGVTAKTDRFETSNTDADVLLQPSECDATESDASVKPSSLSTEKHTEDPAEQICKTDEEKERGEQIGVNLLQEQFDFCQEEDVHVKERDLTKEQSCQPVENLWLQKPEADVLKDGSSTLLNDFPSNELPSSPHGPCESEAEVISPLEEDSFHFSHPSHKGAHSEPCEEDFQLSSSSLSCSPHLLPPSSAPPQDGTMSPGSPPSPADEREPEFPESLWDVVNRIRKHTAPDSENEEEDASESWDLENAGDNVGSEIFSAQQEVSHGEGGNVDEENKQSEENVNESALSSCSASSKVSDDTVTVAEEEKRAEEQ